MAAGDVRSPLARLVAAVEDGTDLLGQAVAVLRARPDPAELALHGVDDPADLPLGVADRRLLAVYEQVTGGPLDLTAACGACGARTTLSLTTASVGEHAWACVLTGAGSGVREPTYTDLVACAGDPHALLARCRLGPAAPGAEPGPAPGGDPWAGLGRAEQSLAGPLRSSCVECGAPVVVDVDVVAMVLRGLVLVCADHDREVHLLASTYGWDLSTIEALPDRRRHRLADLASEVA